MKISLLYLGKIECQRLHLVACEDATAMIESPMLAILIQHPTLGNLLYDTGNSPFYQSIYGAGILDTYPIAEFRSIEQALAEKGLRPSDIDRIILSHLHFDHVGGLRYFLGTKALSNVIVAADELKNAYYSVTTGKAGAYCRELFDLPGVCFRPIEEDCSLAPDLHLFLQASHTPAVIGLRLDLKNEGCCLVTSDTVYTADSYEKGIPPGGSINKTPEEFFENLAYLRKLQETHKAKIIYGHDFAQAKALEARAWID